MDLAQGELGTDESEILNECRERFQLSQAAEAINREQGIFDKKFVNGDQWDTPIRQDRTLNDKPCLTINITAAVRNRIVNACRENRPRIVVHPVGNGSDVQSAKMRDGLIRHIEVDSSADFAYDQAVENAIDMGWGYIGVDGEYEDTDSFDQKLCIVAFPNPFLCYMDPASRLPDGSDMEWFIETTMMPRTQYRQKFGHLDELGWQYLGRGENIQSWSNKEEIRVAKYWRIELRKDTLCRLSDGRSFYKSALPSKADIEATGVTIIEERPTIRRSIKCYLMNAVKILEEREVKGKWIPRVPVYGRSMDLNGVRSLKGIVRDLRDPARMYNYSQTAKTETYALQPKAPWLIAEGQMDGHEPAWRDANRKAIVALPYKPVKLDDGTYAPPPMRQMPPQVNAGFAEWGESTRNDFFAVAGMPHDPNADLKGEVVSGIALRKRQGISDISHYDFYDNLTRSMRHLGRIILGQIPYYYDTPRMIRIISEDGQAQTIKINEKTANKIKNDMTAGEYDAVVDTGPSYQTKREQSAEAMMELLGTPLGELVTKTSGDLIVRAMDFPSSDMVADRLIAAIPAAQMDQNSDMDPKAMAIISGLQAQLKDSNQKQMALELELQSKMGLEQMRQSGEDQRLAVKEAGETHRTQIKAGVAIHDTHVKAVTAHDVAEIGGAVQLLNTNTEAAHDRAAAKEILNGAKRAEE